ncbi:hypothetical protein SPSYN_01419 [Sporotomaculum syntrophicum]|uniref:Uncharacterized protein n=1 Tax=Sporotomaculum syntrophicum TaxID=182264 RepID=A0A9D2WQ34_9FIRM|nr:hypothetical protein [Sporotomaculum syntrophicum]KAF1085283.1 hypothetical protein SPSYN_01419 [Sporotomaculum syntrophicum]
MDKDNALAKEIIDEMAKIAGGLIAQLYRDRNNPTRNINPCRGCSVINANC